MISNIIIYHTITMFKIRCEDDENGELRLFKSFREPYIERLIDFTFN